MGIALWAVPFLFSACFSTNGNQSLPNPAPDPKEFLVENPLITEASGLVASETMPFALWTHNDSGSEPRLYLMNESGKHLGTLYLPNVPQKDWEAIDVVTLAGKKQVIVADIGDNKSKKKHYTLIRFAEPSYSKFPFDDTVRSTQLFQLQYEDGPMDAESFFVDPISKKGYIFSKRTKPAKVLEFSFPEDPATTIVAKEVASIDLYLITAADISNNGEHILVKNYTNLLYWKRNGKEPLADVFKRPAKEMPYKVELQGESVAINTAANSYFTLSEDVKGVDAKLCFYKGLLGK